jgi:hypothetical protein
MKMWLVVLAAVLLFPYRALAGHSVTIGDIEIPGCGDVQVRFSGEATYSYPDTWLYVFTKPAARSYYLMDYKTGSQPNPWSYVKQFAPGDYCVRVYVADQNQLNKRIDEECFTVPVCPPNPDCP